MCLTLYRGNLRNLRTFSEHKSGHLAEGRQETRFNESSSFESSCDERLYKLSKVLNGSAESSDQMSESHLCLKKEKYIKILSGKNN